MMSDLTPVQLAKKMQVEEAGGVFTPPDQYKASKQRISKARKGEKKVVTASSQSVYRHQGDNVFKHNAWAKPIYRDLAPESQELVQMILDPETCMTPVRWPNTYGPSAVFKTKNVLDAKFDANGRSMVLVSPQIEGALFVTAGTSITPFQMGVYTPGADQLLDANILYSQDIVQYDAQTSNYWVAPIFNTQFADVAVPCPRSDISVTNPGIFTIGTGEMLYPIQLETSGASSINIRVVGDFDIGSLGLAYTSYDASNAQLEHIEVFCSDPGIIEVPILTVTQSVARFGIRFYSLIPYSGPLNMIIGCKGSASGLLGYPNESQHCIQHDLTNGQTIVDSAWQQFVIAQSLLLTYEGSTLQNAGQLAIARVQGDSVIGLSNYQNVQYTNWYQAIADLPINNYNGRVSKGGYCWYLGDDESSYFYRPIGEEDYEGLSYMVSEFTTSDTSGTPVRIMVNSVVQFTTDNTAFEQKPSCYIGQDLDHIRYLMSNVRAAYENPTHREQLTKFLKSVGTSVMNVLKSPKTYTTAAQLAALLL
jgi:hypothetical protein